MVVRSVKDAICNKIFFTFEQLEEGPSSPN